MKNSAMTSLPGWLSARVGFLLLVGLATACGGSQNAGSAEDAAATSPESSIAGSAEPSAPAGQDVSAIDVSAIDVCEKIPAAAVATILGSTPENTSGKATMGKYASDCTYTLDTGQGMHSYAIVFVYPPALWSGPDADATVVEGLGDAAYLEQDAAFARLHVLAGSLFIDARADKPEQARALAELALERLGGD